MCFVCLLGEMEMGLAALPQHECCVCVNRMFARACVCVCVCVCVCACVLCDRVGDLFFLP